MKLTDQLEMLKITHDVGDVEKFKEQYLFIKEHFTSEKDVRQIDGFVDKMMKERKKESDRNMEEIRLRCHLYLNKDIIPFSYIAKTYFKKSKAWLYQRINENIVNGKPAKFTENEIKIFNEALQDIGRKIGSIA
ncbi:MAG: DUF5053 domain-containing protein [Tannerella sp.]|jgi:tRNA splicing ligase|nr:DUF5053 domain-containing protein [Tannerella sp.]